MKNAILLIVAVGIVGAFSWVMFSGPDLDPEPVPVKVEKPKRQAAKPAPQPVKTAEAVQAPKSEQPVIATVTNKHGKVVKAVRKASMVSSDDGIFRDPEGKPYPAADQKLLRQAAQAIEKDDLNSARALAMAALKSNNPEVRRAAVESLSWFGSKAIAETTMFLSDTDAEIAEAAKDSWMQGLMEIEEDATKAAIISTALKGLKDGEMIEDVANELVGLDERCALQTIVDLIPQTSGKASEAVKEAYQSITCEEWSNANAAEQWLHENYVIEEE